MKKLIDIPQEVAHKLKVQAAQDGHRSLKSFIEHILTDYSKSMQTFFIMGQGDDFLDISPADKK